MVTIEQNGDLLKAKDVDIIAHQVNPWGVMGAGIARQIKEKYPEVFDKYNTYCKYINDSGGQCLIVKTDDFYVANLFGQYRNTSNKDRMTNYDYLYDALCSLRYQMRELGLKSLGIPYYMSCGIANGNWKIVTTMINEVFKDEGITLIIYKYNG